MKRVALISLLCSALTCGAQEGFWSRDQARWTAANVAAQSLDFATTRLILSRGGGEMNPLARPLVTRGLPGQLAYSYGIGVGGTLLAQYALHRSGHHTLERWLPRIVVGTTGPVAIRNVSVLRGL